MSVHYHTTLFIGCEVSVEKIETKHEVQGRKKSFVEVETSYKISFGGKEYLLSEQEIEDEQVETGSDEYIVAHCFNKMLGTEFRYAESKTHFKLHNYRTYSEPVTTFAGYYVEGKEVFKFSDEETIHTVDLHILQARMDLLKQEFVSYGLAGLNPEIVIMKSAS